MNVDAIENEVHPELFKVLKKNITTLRPSQKKSIDAGLLRHKNLLVCTPTASGKTLVAEIAGINSILIRRGKAVYIAPLKALASEKYKQLNQRYGHLASFALSIGDSDSADAYLAKYDFILTTSEKLDSLIRHHAPWLKDVATIIVDEVHLLDDPSRGPTLEILITMLSMMLKNVQIIALSATIGNPQELAEWLNAELVIDTWRPVELHKGIYQDGNVEFY